MGQANLPLAAGSAHVRAFTRLGWTLQPKRGKGSHMIMTKPGHRATLSIPAHDTVKRGTLQSLIKAAGCSEDEYLAAFGA